MISVLKGKIVDKGKNTITVLTAGGVGYEIYIPSVFLADLKTSEEIILHTYLKVSDSALELYGFLKKEHQDFFKLLLSVSGVGPKTAMNIISLGSVGQIQTAIGKGDVKYLTAVSGIGKKTAERMVVELKSKVQSQKSKVEQTLDSGIISEVIDGLVALGYSREEARGALEGVETKGKTTGQVLKEVLRNISH